MKTITFVFNIGPTGNDAFQEEPREEVIRGLVRAAQDLRNGKNYADLFDLNGNRVGNFHYVEEDDGEE